MPSNKVHDHARTQRWGQWSRPPPLKYYKNIGFLSNAGPDPLKHHKATKQAFNLGPSSFAFRWRADHGPLLVVFGYLAFGY